MKKIFFVAVVLFVTNVTIQAQSVKFGVKAGLNYANEIGTNIIVNSINYKTEAITSYHAGLVAQIGLFKGVAFQPELLYSTQGATYTKALVEIQNELGYISIPAILKIDLNKTFSLELGPQASFLLSEKNTFDAKDANTFDFAAVGGLGLKITKSLFLQARYVLGLTEMSKDAQTKNSVVQISAGILF
ncbi:porin family protein [Flavobacterium sp.]|uniref:porin family protein n=1 Tax=Flavobacterium sp. TaxID=239 RepID=UPI0038FBFDFE